MASRYGDADRKKRCDELSLAVIGQEPVSEETRNVRNVLICYFERRPCRGGICVVRKLNNISGRLMCEKEFAPNKCSGVRVQVSARKRRAQIDPKRNGGFSTELLNSG